LVTQYLKTIAQAYGVEWEDELVHFRPVALDREFVAPSTPSFDARDSLKPSAPIRPSEGSTVVQKQDDEPDFDALSKRFESLRKK
jgi:hypothetical protein